MESPKTLLEAIQYFSDSENCRKFMIAIRWPDGIVKCPHCGSEKVTYLEKARVYRCYSNHPKQKFSLKVGTVFEDSPIALEKWLMASWMLSNCKNGISSYEISRSIGVTQKSAWFMLHRIRVAMGDDNKGKIGGSPKNQVEIDETYVSGNPRNMHQKQRQRHQSGKDNKSIVMGMKTRTTREVRAMVVPNAKRETLQNKILEHVGWGAHIYTDQHVSYQGVDATNLFVHKTVNHMVEYVKGNVHTNGIENFWSLLKRTLKGTYVAVEPFHLDGYVTEQVFRFNNSKGKTDAQRFNKVLSQVAGKRLTYAELTGKEAGAEIF
jgi:transposase-like protein